MRALFGLATVLGAIILSGCAREQLPANPVPAPAVAGTPATNAPSPDRPLIVTAEQGLKGEVAWVNRNLRFLVITFPSGQMPAVDQRLNVYRRGLKVGEVKISGPQQDESTVADIMAGEVDPGDEVRDR